MKTKNKLLCALLALAVCFAVAACGGNDTPAGNTPTAAVSPASAQFTSGSGGDLVFMLTLSDGAEFTGVAGAGITADGYTYAQPALTVKASFLNTLAAGEYTLTVETTAENDPTIALTVRPQPTATAIAGEPFAVTDLVPYDQPTDGAGAIPGRRVASQAYTVSYGTADAEAGSAYSLIVTGYESGLVSGKLYYRITTDAALTEAPASTDGWNELKDGVLTGADGRTESGTYYLNVILVSSDVADMGQTVTFDVTVSVG